MAKETKKTVALPPVTLKDFRAGQEVYALSEETVRGAESKVPSMPVIGAGPYAILGSGSRRKEFKVTRMTVTGVGRKYVRAGEGEDPDPRWATEFYDTGDGHAYLTENKDWGHRRMLFASKETVDAYLRKRELYDRLQTRVNLGAAQFTLEELEAVDAVLGGAAEQQAEEKEG